MRACVCGVDPASAHNKPDKFCLQQVAKISMCELFQSQAFAICFQ